MHVLAKKNKVKSNINCEAFPNYWDVKMPLTSSHALHRAFRISA